MHKNIPLSKEMVSVPVVLKVFLAVAIGVVASCLLWYNIQLSPVVGGNTTSPIKIKIKAGSTPKEIAEDLESHEIIRNATAFKVYLKLSGKANSLKAGTYSLFPTEKTSQIVKRLVDGRVEAFRITFYPGATLKDNSARLKSKKQDVTTVLRRAGYADSEISEAMAASYDGPVFAGKPANADLEGYIFGETYQFNEGVSVKKIFQRAFDELYSKIEKNDLITKFKNRGLSLYEGLTLASIIQREEGSEIDQKKIAQVFYNRLERGMNLGSDPTYQYAADKLGVERDTALDSPYNTRRYGGLPPGPIGSPGLSALLAVAEPTPSDYLYFLSGDDDITYFATDEYGHNINIASHCLVKCSIP